MSYGKQHALVVDRIIATWLEGVLSEDAEGGSDNLFSSSLGAAGLHKEERMKVREAAIKKLKRLEASSRPLKKEARNWVSDLR